MPLSSTLAARTQDLTMEQHGELAQFKKTRDLGPEEKQERETLIAFLTALSKSFLQTSVYTADHPKAKEGVDLAYTHFAELAKSCPELTLIVTSWLEKPTLAVDGLFAEPIPIGDVIEGVMGETYGHKMHTYCQRSRLISFSIKNTIKRAEFHRFIQVFVERDVQVGDLHLSGDVRDTREAARFTNSLIRERVVNVTVVMIADLLESKRRVPWRVRIAMARLKKDLLLIPLSARRPKRSCVQPKSDSWVTSFVH